MRCMRKLGCGLALALAIGPGGVQAATLGSIDASMTLGFAEPPPPDQQTAFLFDFGGFIFNLEYGGTVFDLMLSSADVGQTISVSSGTEFDEAVGFLTNGVNDWITFQFGGGGTGWTEGGFFYGDVDGDNGIDFAGAQIDSIDLHVNNLGLTTGPDPALYWYRLDALVSIEGVPAIPEPATVMTLMAGLAGMPWVARRRSRAGQGAKASAG